MKKLRYYDRPKRRSGLIRLIVWLLIIGVIFSLLVLFGVFKQDTVSESAKSPLPQAEQEALIPRGKELALAGDCFGCHSRSDGEKGAGGVPIATPFGTIYSTNITPDKDFGIGDYTREDFHRALKDGVGKKGNLFPAMPFVFTHITTDRDLDALYAYIMSIPPLQVPNAKNSGVFELPVRPFMNFWTLLNFPDRKVPIDENRSDVWNRGAYLVEGLAHCGACHSPRNFMMGVKFSDALAGGFESGMAIPDIRAERLAKNGYSVADLTQYLSTGIAPEGSSFAGMNTVTHFSTSQMNLSDVKAMATYLLTDSKGKLLTPEQSPIVYNQVVGRMKQGDREKGREYYMAACAGCHGLQGEGTPNVAPSLSHNAIVEMQDPQTFIGVILHGLQTTNYTNGQRMYAMPGFNGELKPEQIADLLTWIRAEWGGIDQGISTKEVDKAL
ncbi:cytochrome c [Ignatzschineria rhizosphaerae]|uniref:Cytochrome c n=1 Tax=Ignatzschineria rhizosphaerae TaxID=2923279 RepID=A0ABY3X2P7_9GAMM|nr:cytochrome c [Ignatzschineria rhizosphaerae]UNM95974.1 cytochrome c [Ignatzschineria rhizosphaerae]